MVSDSLYGVSLHHIRVALQDKRTSSLMEPNPRLIQEEPPVLQCVTMASAECIIWISTMKKKITSSDEVEACIRH